MSIGIHLNGLDRWPEVAALAAPLRRAAEAALHEAGRHLPAGEMSITFLDDVSMRALNRAWLKRDRPTDVLAFPLSDPEHFLADVYIGVEEAERNAGKLGVPLGEELQRLVIHGVLHALGHEHPEGEARESSEMFRIQEELVRRLRAQ